MTEQVCKKLIRSKVEEVQARCGMLLEDIDRADLTDVDRQLDWLERDLADAKSHLRACEDY